MPLTYVILKQPLLYNGWRHFYFLYAGIAAMGALGMQAVWEAMGQSRARRRIAAVALGLAFAFQAVGIVINHPYQYAYYNLLAGKVEHRYELDYWDVSTVNAMRKLAAQAETGATSPLVLGGRDEMSLFGITHGYEVLSAQMRERITLTTDSNAPYLFYNATYADIYGVAPPEGYHALFSLASYGNTLCIVYQKDGQGA